MTKRIIFRETVLKFLEQIYVLRSVRSISTYGNAQNNTLTSQLGGFEFSWGESSRIFEFAFFRVFPVYFVHFSLTQQQRTHSRSVTLKIVEYGGGIHAEERFYFRYTWQLRLVSGSLGHLEIALSIVKKNWGSWKNSATFYRYSSCFVWSVSHGPQFGWTGRAFYGKLSSAAKTYSLYHTGNLFVHL